MSDDGFQAFAASIRADAERIFVTRGGKVLRLSQLSKSDQGAYIDRWFADGVDPRGDRKTEVVPEAPAPEPAKPEEPAGLLADGAGGELFYGWVQRALVPGPGFEWARVEIPRYAVEALSVPDKIGRRIRQDTREVMTHEVIAELGSWELGNRVRKAVTS